jgi:two-component system, cell cycle response regulator CpdR
MKESGKQGAQILVVDDEAIVRRCIKMLLEHDGHRVWPVDSGEAALEQLSQRSFDLVITDFSMPGMHGDQMVARIRQMIPTQPIIMATAFVDDYQIFGQASGRVDALLLKPFSLKQLREAIEQALSSEKLDRTTGLPPIPTPSPIPEFISPT